ncbi:MAG: hypothetical protein ABF379_11305 [Akkermansiaceae bacterium]|jgi:hypothetical protein
MSNFPVIITPKLIRRHNLRCLGRILLWTLGSSAVFLVVFLFAWVIASLFAGHRALTPPILIFSTFVGIGVFVLGYRYFKKHGPQDWERIAQKPDRKPGMRLARMSNQEYGQVGQGLCALILAGPDWISRIGDERRSFIRSSDEVANDLETLRQHFAARDSWVPMKDFLNHEAEIYLLAKLEMLSIREFAGEWHFHVTVQGTVKRLQAAELEA